MKASDLLARTNSDGDCLRWSGAHISTGYGHVRFDGKTRSVHRVMYELTHGEISEAMDIDHTCFVRDCINPDHLEAVSHHENLRRSATAGRNILSRIDPDFCPQGHQRGPGNIRWEKGINQGCLTCHRERSAKKRDCTDCGKKISARHMAEHMRAMHDHGKVA